jgi:TetR/AcrR family transcriptional repressor of nem operon
MARTKQFDPAATLDRAVDAFWRQGFEATAVQELCQRMGINPGSLYGAYGDKRALFMAVLDRYIETVSREAIERIGREPSGLAGIRSYFQHIIDAIIDGKRRWGCLVTNSLVELAEREPEIATKISLHFARLETAFAGALARGKAAGELKPAVTHETAGYLVCIVQGLHVLAKTKPRREQLEGVVTTVLQGLAVEMDPTDTPGRCAEADR